MCEWVSFYLEQKKKNFIDCFIKIIAPHHEPYISPVLSFSLPFSTVKFWDIRNLKASITQAHPHFEPSMEKVGVFSVVFPSCTNPILRYAKSVTVLSIPK